MKVGAFEHVGHRSPWWTAAYVVTIGGGVAAGVAGVVMAMAMEALALAIVLLLSALWLRFLDRRVPRRVRASAEGVSVWSPVRARNSGWDEVRRVRTAGGTPAYDTHLDLMNGVLVSLPARLPAGTIERWRDDLSGSRQQSVLPDTWRVPEQAFSWRGMVSAVVISFVMQLALREFGVFGVAAVVVGVALFLSVFWHFNPWNPPERVVTADETEVRYGRGGRRRLRWAEVAKVRPLDAYQDTPVLERHDGSVVKVAGPPLSLLQRWHEANSSTGPRQDLDP